MIHGRITPANLWVHRVITPDCNRRRFPCFSRGDEIYDSEQRILLERNIWFFMLPSKLCSSDELGRLDSRYITRVDLQIYSLFRINTERSVARFLSSGYQLHKNDNIKKNLILLPILVLNSERSFAFFELTVSLLSDTRIVWGNKASRRNCNRRETNGLVIRG